MSDETQKPKGKTRKPQLRNLLKRNQTQLKSEEPNWKPKSWPKTKWKPRKPRSDTNLKYQIPETIPNWKPRNQPTPTNSPATGAATNDKKKKNQERRRRRRTKSVKRLSPIIHRVQQCQLCQHQSLWMKPFFENAHVAWQEHNDVGVQLVHCTPHS